ncbi:MAG: YciI family protein [Actinomycetota bacterium]
MNGQPPATADRSGLLARDYWLILSTPVAGTSQAAIEAQVDAHIAWVLALEQDGTLFLSGPLLSGPGTGPGSGVTVLRAASEDAARAIAAGDPFAQAGLRTFQVHRWRLNEGCVSVRVSLGTGTNDWQ